MATVKLYIPDEIKQQVEEYLPNFNWSGYFVTQIMSEIARRRYKDFLPGETDEAGLQKIVDRLRQCEFGSNASKWHQGYYEGYLWAKHYATLSYLKLAVTLPVPDSIGRLPDVGKKPMRNLDLARDLDLANGLMHLEWRHEGNSYAQRMFKAHCVELGIQDGLVQEPKNPSKRPPAPWAWSYRSDGTLNSSKGTVHETIDAIYQEFGGFCSDVQSPAYQSWAKGFLDGAALIYNLVKDSFVKKHRKGGA